MGAGGEKHWVHRRETFIRRTVAAQDWSVFSEDPHFIRKLTKLYGAGEKISQHGYEWTVPKDLIRFRKKRVLTPAHKAKLRAQIDKMQAKRKKKTEEECDPSS